MKLEFFLLAALGCFCAANSAEVDIKSVKEWTAGDLMIFFEKDCEVAVDATKILDLKARDSFDGTLLLDPAVLSDLGITSTDDQARVLKAFGYPLLNPVYIWEWRAANRGLCDLWIAPMVTIAPRITLIWLHSIWLPSSNETRTSPIGKIYGEMFDDTSIITKIIWLIIFPRYPLWRISAQFHYSGWIDTYIYLMLLLGVLVEALALFSKIKEDTFVPHLVVDEVVGLCVALFSYYILYFILPNFVLDFFFSLDVYLCLGILRYLFCNFVACFGLPKQCKKLDLPKQEPRPLSLAYSYFYFDFLPEFFKVLKSYGHF